MGALDSGGETDYRSFAAQQGDWLVIDLERTACNLRPRFIVYNAAGQGLRVYDRTVVSRVKSSRGRVVLTT